MHLGQVILFQLTYVFTHACGKVQLTSLLAYLCISACIWRKSSLSPHVSARPWRKCFLNIAHLGILEHAYGGGVISLSLNIPVHFCISASGRNVLSLFKSPVCKFLHILEGAFSRALSLSLSNNLCIVFAYLLRKCSFFLHSPVFLHVCGRGVLQSSLCLSLTYEVDWVLKSYYFLSLSSPRAVFLCDCGGSILHSLPAHLQAYFCILGRNLLSFSTHLCISACLWRKSNFQVA